MGHRRCSSSKMKVVLLTALFVACASATVEVESVLGYHSRVAIPMAAKIRAAEETIKAENRNVNIGSRIVGGGVAAPNSHPYLAGLVITYVNRTDLGVCGAALVSRTRLLTAAHCWYDGVDQARRFVVVLGSQFLFSGGDRTKSYSVVTHPDWNPVSQLNNLAVIILKSPVILTRNIQPIPLATNVNETFVGQWGLASGYGFTSDNQTGVSVLSVVHEVSLEVISNDDCRSVFGAIVQQNTLCTSGAGGVGTCRGDAGGPIVTLGANPKLIGVGTFGAAIGCQAGFPSGFSRITRFLEFISKFI